MKNNQFIVNNDLEDILENSGTDVQTSPREGGKQQKAMQIVTKGHISNSEAKKKPIMPISVPVAQKGHVKTPMKPNNAKFPGDYANSPIKVNDLLARSNNTK